jgi:hypothetical protein
MLNKINGKMYNVIINMYDSIVSMSFKNNEKRKGNRFTPCLTPFAQSKYSDIQLLYEIQGFILSYILIITLYILPLILFNIISLHIYAKTIILMLSI